MRRVADQSPERLDLQADVRCSSNRAWEEDERDWLQRTRPFPQRLSGQRNTGFVADGVPGSGIGGLQRTRPLPRVLSGQRTTGFVADGVPGSGIGGSHRPRCVGPTRAGRPALRLACPTPLTPVVPAPSAFAHWGGASRCSPGRSGTSEHGRNLLLRRPPFLAFGRTQSLQGTRMPQPGRVRLVTPGRSGRRGWRSPAATRSA
jgi:hypothetical protein